MLLGCVVVSVVLLVADLAVTFAVYGADADRAALLPALLDTDGEANLPAWFTSMLLAAGALAAVLRGRELRAAGAAWVGHWFALGAVLLVLSIDEAAVLHEEAVGPLGDVAEALGLGGDAARLAAVAIVGATLAALALPFLRWLRALPRPARTGMLAGVALLVGCALGMETIARLLEQWRGTYGLADDLLSTAEEFGEMLGATAFLVATLTVAGEPAGDEAAGAAPPAEAPVAVTSP